MRAVRTRLTDLMSVDDASLAAAAGSRGTLGVPSAQAAASFDALSQASALAMPNRRLRRWTLARADVASAWHRP